MGAAIQFWGCNAGEENEENKGKLPRTREQLYLIAVIDLATVGSVSPACPEGPFGKLDAIPSGGACGLGRSLVDP